MAYILDDDYQSHLKWTVFPMLGRASHELSDVIFVLMLLKAVCPSARLSRRVLASLMITTQSHWRSKSAIRRPKVQLWCELPSRVSCTLLMNSVKV